MYIDFKSDNKSRSPYISQPGQINLTNYARCPDQKTEEYKPDYVPRPSGWSFLPSSVVAFGVQRPVFASSSSSSWSRPVPSAPPRLLDLPRPSAMTPDGAAPSCPRPHPARPGRTSTTRRCPVPQPLLPLLRSPSKWKLELQTV
jgi:hypothetical protein